MRAETHPSSRLKEGYGQLHGDWHVRRLSLTLMITKLKSVALQQMRGF